MNNNKILKYDELAGKAENTEFKDIIEKEYQKSRELQNKVIVVLDDDPTGIQTVHGINVYMEWHRELLKKVFEKENLFYIQTNSRALKSNEARDINKDIMENIVHASRKSGRDFSVISRSDSTLRGHYPLETQALREAYEKSTGKLIDGEILIPFFLEGGRLTAEGVHYVRQGGDLIPAALTEFARDSVFSFKSSDLSEYIEEKHRGAYKAEEVVKISLETIRRFEIENIVKTLENIKDFGKVVVDAVNYEDLKIFVTALLKAEKRGKRFIFRTAASFVKTYGFIEDKELLTGEEIIGEHEKGSVLIVVGSHVSKTTKQLEELLKCSGIVPLELDVSLVLKDEGIRQREIKSKAECINEVMEMGLNPLMYTSRKLVRTESPAEEDNLNISKIVSQTLSSIVNLVSKRPSCIIAKGGITSSDVAVKGLEIRKARVLGQIQRGIPVILSGEESKWPGLPYIIFPGNVGEEDTLRRIYSIVTST